MTDILHNHPAPASHPGTPGRAARVLGPGFWAAVSIVAMWLAVLFDGVFGGMMTFASPSTPNLTTIPSAVLVALFAAIGTGSVAKRAFTRKDPPQ